MFTAGISDPQIAILFSKVVVGKNRLRCFGIMHLHTAVAEAETTGIIAEVKNFIANDRDMLIDPDEPKVSAAQNDPLRNVIDSTATVRDAAPTQKPSQTNAEPPKTAPKAEAKEMSTAKPKAATAPRQSAAKAPADDPLRGNMNPPIEKAEAEEGPLDEAVTGQQSMFDMMR